MFPRARYKWIMTTLCSVSLILRIHGLDPCPGPCTCYFKQSEYVVDCSHRYLRKVPQGLPLTSNIVLLNNNALRNLTTEDFRGLSEIVSLNLADNEIELLNGSVFQSLSRLETLALANNKLNLTPKVFHPHTFYGLRSLRSLNLNRNSAVNNQPDLNYPESALSLLTHLEELFIDGLEFKNFGEKFKQLKNLQTINLSGYDGRCNLHIITGDTFKHLESLPLSTVNISHCNVTRVDEESLSYFHHLKTLDVSGHHILHGEPLFIRNLTFSIRMSPIKYLFLKDIREWTGDHEVTKRDIEFLQNTSITHLYFDNSSLHKLADDTPFVLPQTLEYISLTFNKLKGGLYLRNSAGLENLKTAVGSYQYFFTNEVRTNQISHNSSLGYFKAVVPKNLENAFIDHCKLNYPILHVRVSEPYNIKKVDLSGNQMKAWLGPVTGGQKLEDLDLSDNNCETTSFDFFAAFPNLKILRLAGNYLGPTIDRDKEGALLKHSKSLRVLDVSRNGMSRISRNLLHELLHLEELYVNHNSVWNLEADFTRLQNLNVLDLSYNSLPALPITILNALDTINDKNHNLTIDISGNPLECNCNTQKFIEWLQKTKVIFRKKSNYSCELVNKTFVTFAHLTEITYILDKQCSSYLGWIIIAVASAVFFSVLTVGIIVYRFRWRLRYLWYMTLNRYEERTSFNRDGSKEYAFDAFISFEDELRPFINEKVIPKMEHEKHYKLCLHHRDFTPGLSIEKNVSKAIRDSFRTIILLNEDFLHSYWCMYEFNMVRMEKFYSGRDCFVMVLMEDIPIRKLPTEAMEILKSKTFIEYPNESSVNDQLWCDLERAMQRPGSHRNYGSTEC